MPKFTPTDTSAFVNDVSPPDPGPEQIDVAPGGFPEIQQNLVQVHVEGDIILAVFGDDIVGGSAFAQGHIEVFDGSTWQTVASDTINVGRDATDSSAVNGPFNVVIALVGGDLSDVDVRARGDCSSGNGASDSEFDVDIDDWHVVTRRRNMPAIV